MTKNVINDSTKQQLGTIYQHFIALLKCFEMEENDVILIETDGDVSKIAYKGNKSFQMEVKHHYKEDILTDQDSDFWKTLRNWILSHSEMKKYDKLVFFTTSQLSRTCKYLKWNKIDIDQRISIINEIGTASKTESECRNYYSQIIENAGADEVVMRNILGKVIIEQQNPQIKNISVRFADKIAYIPEENRDLYIEALLGTIMGKVKEPPHKWIITKAEFDKFVQTLAPSFMNPNMIPLPTSYSTANPTIEQLNDNMEKRFVSEIKKIRFEKVINKAILEYWRMDMTLIECLQGNPVYMTNILQYRDDMKAALYYMKLTEQNGEEVDRSEQIKKSQTFYSRVMAMQASNFGNFINNRLFFKNGVVHDVVNTSEFSWDIGEDYEY